MDTDDLEKYIDSVEIRMTRMTSLVEERLSKCIDRLKVDIDRINNFQINCPMAKDYALFKKDLDYHIEQHRDMKGDRRWTFNKTTMFAVVLFAFAGMVISILGLVIDMRTERIIKPEDIKRVIKQEVMLKSDNVMENK